MSHACSWAPWRALDTLKHAYAIPSTKGIQLPTPSQVIKRRYHQSHPPALKGKNCQSCSHIYLHGWLWLLKWRLWLHTSHPPHQWSKTCTPCSPSAPTPGSSYYSLTPPTHSILMCCSQTILPACPATLAIMTDPTPGHIHSVAGVPLVSKLEFDMIKQELYEMWGTMDWLRHDNQEGINMLIQWREVYDADGLLVAY